MATVTLIVCVDVVVDPAVMFDTVGVCILADCVDVMVPVMICLKCLAGDGRGEVSADTKVNDQRTL